MTFKVGIYEVQIPNCFFHIKCQNFFVNASKQGNRDDNDDHGKVAEMVVGAVVILMVMIRWRQRGGT